MTHGIRSLLIVAVAATALALVACGDGSPTSPSGTKGVVVRGVLLGEGAAFTASSNRSGSESSGPITVVVEGTGISVTISGNGTFEIEDIPAGTFTLIFLQDGAERGRITITAEDGMEVKIVVKKEDSVIVLVDLELEDDDDDDDDTNKTCMIDGGRVGDRIELEGKVTSGSSSSFQMTTEGNRASGPVDVNASGASFKCNGKSGGDSCAAAVKTGAKVHVRGTLTVCTLENATITASEVKVQKAADEDDDEDDD